MNDELPVWNYWDQMQTNFAGMFFLVGLTRNSDFVQNKTFLSEGQVLLYFAGTLYLYYDMVF
jgi:hypothetical protein